MRKAEIITSAVFLLISALVLYEAFSLGFGWGLEGPQPGFFIFYLALALGPSSVIRIVQVLSDRGLLPGTKFVSAKARPEVVKVFLPMAGAIFCLTCVE